MDRIAQINQLLESSPADGFLHHALALEYLKINDLIRARREFLFNLKTDPDYLATFYHLGKLEEKEGNTDAAIRYYEQGMAVAKKQNDQHAYNELQAAHEDLTY